MAAFSLLQPATHREATGKREWGMSARPPTTRPSHPLSPLHLPLSPYPILSSPLPSSSPPTNFFCGHAHQHDVGIVTSTRERGEEEPPPRFMDPSSSLPSFPPPFVGRFHGGCNVLKGVTRQTKHSPCKKPPPPPPCFPPSNSTGSFSPSEIDSLFPRSLARECRE